jgi:prepilin-type N-terminal cleavage/methylation domain-containing protein
MSTLRNRRARAKAAGFTLVEGLMSLAILAVLLAALGTAVYASMESFRENERVATSSQTVRGVLQRMMREVRTAAALDANSGSITIIPPDDGSGLQRIQYQYDPAAKVLNYRKTIGGQTYSYVACGEGGTLTQFSVSTQTGMDWQGLTCIKGVRVTLGLKLGPETFTVTSSASPRRNQTF